jgi:hypothetical protein
VPVALAGLAVGRDGEVAAPTAISNTITPRTDHRVMLNQPSLVGCVRNAVVMRLGSEDWGCWCGVVISSLDAVGDLSRRSLAQPRGAIRPPSHRESSFQGRGHSPVIGASMPAAGIATILPGQSGEALTVTNVAQYGTSRVGRWERRTEWPLAAAAALDWADDGPREPVVHERLDRAGHQPFPLDSSVPCGFLLPTRASANQGQTTTSVHPPKSLGQRLPGACPL